MKTQIVKTGDLSVRELIEALIQMPQDAPTNISNIELRPIESCEGLSAGFAFFPQKVGDLYFDHNGKTHLRDDFLTLKITPAHVYLGE